MNPNITLLGQMISFAILIWFTVKFIWPPLMKAIEDRQQKIAEGLAAADRSQKDLAQAQDKVNDVLKDARTKANDIIEQAHARANQIVDQAKNDAVASRSTSVLVSTMTRVSFRRIGRVRKVTEPEHTRRRIARQQVRVRFALASA